MKKTQKYLKYKNSDNIEWMNIILNLKTQIHRLTNYKE